MVQLRTCAIFTALIWLVGCAHPENVASGRAILDMNPQVAIEVATRAIESGNLSSSDLAIAYQNRGAAYLIENRYQLAIDDFSRAISIEDRDELRSNRGVAYRRNGAYDSALADYDVILRRNPNNYEVQMNRVHALWAKGDMEGALRSLDDLIARRPNDAGGYNLSCWLLAIVGMHDQALMNCDRSLALRPNDTNGIAARAHAHLKAQRFEMAIVDYDLVLSRRPSADSYYGRGLARMGVGDSIGAESDFAAAKRIYPTIADDFDKGRADVRVVNDNRFLF